MPPASDPTIHVLVNNLFRHTAGRMVATLTRIFGPRHLELAEDVVQDALLRALASWRFGTVPANPSGWLMSVARNLALDVVRREASLRSKESEIASVWTSGTGAAPSSNGAFADELHDDELRMMFACCSPEIPEDAQVALTLKTLGGFGVPEIARAFLTTETAIAQRLVRAKRRILDGRVDFEVPAPAELPARRDSVLDVLYLMFNEGIGAHQGPSLIREELVREAIRLAGLLAAHPRAGAPKVHALLALMLLQAARLPARVDLTGHPLLLAEQDRSRWDQVLIRQGFHHLSSAGTGNELSTFHIEAGIASCHAMAPTFEATNWMQILRYYDLLLEVNPSPIVTLNRTVAVSMTQGPAAALAELDALSVRDRGILAGYYLLPCLRAEYLRQLGNHVAATAQLQRALGLACSDPEKEFLRRRLERTATRPA